MNLFNTVLKNNFTHLFFVKEDNEFIYIENFYDYTDKNLDKAQWYVEVRDSGPMWTEPSFAGAAKRLVADYGVPFYKTNPKTGEKTLAGTLTSTITLKSLHSLLMAQSQGNTGYAYAISKNIVLAPDFESYKTLTPGSLPGTVKDLVIPGWQAISSYFDYRDVNYNTNFGYDEFIRQNNVPEYHFNILLKRHIISPFISTVIPLLVVAIMLFGVVLSTTKNRQKNVLAGFSAFGVVQTCAAFFFVIMLAHIDLRQAMDTEEITYIEYFYFIMYLKLLLVVFDVILFSNTKNTTIINYKDNLIMKLFYWPLLLSICLVITLLKFY